MKNSEEIKKGSRKCRMSLLKMRAQCGHLFFLLVLGGVAQTPPKRAGNIVLIPAEKAPKTNENI